MTEPSPNTSHAQQARRLLLRHVLKVLPEVVKDVSTLLDKLPESGDSSDKIQFAETLRRSWLTLALPWQRAAGQRLLGQASGTTSSSPLSSELRLLDEEDVEFQILAGRLAQTLAAPAQDEFNDLRLRLQHLEQSEELAGNDAVQPVHLAQATLGAWSEVGLTRDDWQHCKPVIEPRLASTFNEACHLANAWLLQQGVLPHIDLRALVRRGRDGATPHPTEAAAPAARNGTASAGGTPVAAKLQDMTQRMRKLLADHIPAAARWLGNAAPASAATASGAETGANNGAGAGPAKPRSDATTLMVAMPHPPTPGALRAADAGAIAPEAYQAGVAELRQQTRALKSAASSQQDKAVIEVVALIFDSILAEERLPPSIRVWFARLQMPVLRVALVDADFLGSTDHPARLLLDRMGACVMGFDAGVSLEPLEAEMRRIVQVVEQYPETGRKVFEIVYKEFEAFLSQHLLDRGDTQRLANLAEQVELKETLTVKFTIELRKLLGQAPVAEPVRDFLFHVWTEVLAVATVRHGAQHDVSTGFRAVAGELLWMASAKPTRAERAKVIGRLPGLMAQLREGMSLLGLAAKLQEQHIKRVSDALVEAFMARTQPLSDQWLQEMTQRLGSLDAYLADTEVEQIKLDQYSIEMITGVDASDIVVVPDTEQKVLAALRAWAKALERGAWFELSHNGFSSLVQLSWRSPQKQLFLFAGPERRSFLLQQGRVASYLEAGLLKPCEPETLTLRATRDALNKLDANPERLLA
ncbi:MAG: DUF1631 family protein [Hydrogenophaga sp.]|nr:DUF1631 family protein [Hydrogenophaga sp.]